MKVNINFEITKTRFFIVLSVIAVVSAGLIVQAQFSGPSQFGHQSDEIDWTQEIPQIMTADIIVDGQSVAAATTNEVYLGDIVSGDGLRDLILKAGDTNIVTLTSNQMNLQGNLCINGDCKSNWGVQIYSCPSGNFGFNCKGQLQLGSSCINAASGATLACNPVGHLIPD